MLNRHEKSISVYPYPRRKEENIGKPYKFGNLEVSIERQEVTNTKTGKTFQLTRPQSYELLIFFAHNIEQGINVVSQENCYDFLFNNRKITEELPEMRILTSSPVINDIRNLLRESESGVTIDADWRKHLIINVRI